MSQSVVIGDSPMSIIAHPRILFCLDSGTPVLLAMVFVCVLAPVFVWTWYVVTSFVLCARIYIYDPACMHIWYRCMKILQLYKFEFVHDYIRMCAMHGRHVYKSRPRCIRTHVYIVAID